MPPEWNACARQSRVCPCYTTWCAPIIRCCAAVGGSAALRMRHTPCGCRSASLAVVQPNHRLPEHSTMRRAKQCRYFASSLPPSKRHSRLTIVRRGCNRCRIAGIHGEAMYTAPDCAARAALQAANCQCAGSRGKTPCVLLGDLKGAILSRERMAPFNAPPARCRDKSSDAALHHPRALAARFNL